MLNLQLKTPKSESGGQQEFPGVCTRFLNEDPGKVAELPLAPERAPELSEIRAALPPSLIFRNYRRNSDSKLRLWPGALVVSRSSQWAVS